MSRSLLSKGLALSLITVAITAQAQATIPVPRDVPYPGVIQLHVDATDLDRRVFRVRETLPVKPGALTLHFPRFLPGNHGPTGEINNLAGLKIRAVQSEVAWTRDTVDSFAFHLEVPKGVSSLDLEFQFLSAVNSESGRVVITREMLNLQWNSVVLYPVGHFASAIQVKPSVKLPPGWSEASALRVARQQGDELEYLPVSLETLVDSPIYAGKHVKRVELDPPGTPRPIVLNLVGDEPENLKATEEQLNAHRQLVQQADKLFGARHFDHYDFLLAISDHLGGIGLEHHQSSENGVRTNYFKDWAKQPGSRALLPHEFVHSWNGKFRRPADLWTPDYNVPMRNSLLWLYEGQTQFWGRMLAARSGLVTPAQARDGLAQVAATYEYRAGRLWRNLQDTTNQPTMGNRRARADWGDWQRNADYYDEATLIWLDADSLIRERSGGAKSLDDFARAFFGVENGRIKPLTYSFDDIVAALNGVLPYDWHTFLRSRLDTTGPGAPLDGLARSGWKLAWAEAPSEFSRSADDPEARSDDYNYSIGITVRRDGHIDNVMWEGPAFKAGLSRAAQILAVNGVAYKAERLSSAITANKDGKTPLTLIVKDGDAFRSVQIDYQGGLRYPRLERVEGTPERLDAGVLAPRS